VTLVLDAAVLGKIELPTGAPAPLFVIEAGGRRVSGQVSAKGLRKAIATIAEHGPEQVAVILQGKLEPGDVIAKAGLVVQVKATKT